MVELDPRDHDIAELGPKVREVDDLADLEEMLEIEEGGPNREDVKTLLVSRIKKLEAEEEEEDAGDVDPSEHSVAELGNVIRKIDDVDELEVLLEEEKKGQDRKTAKRLIEQQLDSVRGSDEEEGEERERLSPEEKYPELDHPTADKQYVEELEGGVYRDMWVYCETQRGALIDVSREMLGKARELMDDYNEQYDEDERVVAVVIGDEVEGLAEETIEYGADVAVYTEDPRLERFYHKPYTEVFCEMARAGSEQLGRGEEVGWKEVDGEVYDEPRYTLFPATNNGRDLSALVQGELDSGLASDCSGLYIEETVISNPAKTGEAGEKKEFERVLHMKRPDFSGFEYSTILCLDAPDREFHPQGASVIPGSFEMPEPDPEREGEVVEFDATLSDDWFRVTIEGYDRLEGGVDLTGREVIVALGRGIGDDPTRGMELGLELADAFEDADLGITRGIVTSSYQFEGHVEQYSKEERQIGETGQVVEPDVYIAAGISGAIQHKVGMDESDTIISINTDTEADIRDFSDYFIEGDLFDVLPQLTEAVERGELDVRAVADGSGRDRDGDAGGEGTGGSRSTTEPRSDGGEN